MSETMDPRAPQRVRHDTRMRLLDVVSVTDITPLMRRIRLRGDMEGFASVGHADHIKVFIFPRGVAPKIVPIGERGAEFAEGERPEMRDYTPRFWSVEEGWIDLDFVLHGDGPASGWAAQAQVGQTLLIAGPRGSLVVPPAYDWYLLAGDETALPALARRIEELPAGSKVVAVIEVDSKAEEQSFETRADLSLTWLHRNGRHAGTTSLVLDAIKAMNFPAGDAYSYIAGEGSMSRAVKAHLIETRGFNPEYVRSAGYWLLDTPDAHEPH